MTDRENEARAAQTQYYARTGAEYDALQVDPLDAHAYALGWLAALIDQHRYESVLDVGSGTGRALVYLKNQPGLRLRGIEPSQTLRKSGHAKGLSLSELTPGDVLALEFADDSFDIVCAFGVLHHIRDHRRAVSEMRRVAKHAVFISDANNFGQGGAVSRAVKQCLHALGLWKSFDYVRSGFKGYHFSEGDGIFYSYSLHDDIGKIRQKFPDVLYMSTRPSGANLYRTAQTIAIFAMRANADRRI
jgi:ubiquinone/menaquinone biosynthesis C-methylase UbiE